MSELPQAGNGGPVCIAGMHRSGTSSTAQLLYWSGVYLGREEELFAAGPANPDGYWENGRFVSINNRIFEEFGGGWDLPPSPDDMWRDPERLGRLKRQARVLTREFEGHEPWGWKDPRSALTMPFWLDLLPDTKVVLCVRNPLEVALSLRKRGNSSLAFGFNLWTVYNRRVLDALGPGRYVVTHYESYFYRPERELRRVLDFLGIPASDQLIAHARSSALKGLRHHTAATDELRERSRVSPPGMLDLYERLCLEADWNPEQPASREGAEEVGRPVG